ncbi:MAG: hypothetical protein V3V72_01030 [Ignavibacteriaceae bacterium]
MNSLWGCGNLSASLLFYFLVGSHPVIFNHRIDVISREREYFIQHRDNHNRHWSTIKFEYSTSYS